MLNRGKKPRGPGVFRDLITPELMKAPTPAASTPAGVNTIVVFVSGLVKEQVRAAVSVTQTLPSKSFSSAIS
jgi:hypothetical protein